jgi:hypothetical protein
MSERSMINLTGSFGNHILGAQFVIAGRLDVHWLLKSH